MRAACAWLLPPIAAEPQPEVLVRELQLASGPPPTPQLKVGAPFTLEAEISRQPAQRVRVTLYQDEVENPGDGHRDIDLAPGRNLVRFPQRAQNPRVRKLSGEGQRCRRWTATRHGAAAARFFAGNNQALAGGKGRRACSISKAIRRPRLPQAGLTSENIDVEARNPWPAAQRQGAFTLRSCPFVRHLGDADKAKRRCWRSSYVRDYGGGFIMTGGENSFGSGGYQSNAAGEAAAGALRSGEKRSAVAPGWFVSIARDR